MKIKTKELSYEQVLNKVKAKHMKPKVPNIILTTAIRLFAEGELRKTHFSYTKERMDEAGEGPYLILMNHSAFIDLKIASKIFYPMPYNIVCTSDGFVGKDFLMRLIGCIPTQKFVTDLTLISDIMHAIKKNKTSVLMYPEASYSFDGCATPLPQNMGVLIKKLGVPVLMVKTSGAFLHDPLYNCLQLRDTKVSAVLKCLLTKDEISSMDSHLIDEVLKDAFTFDSFKEQYDNKTVIDESFRADGLHRILYRCCECNAENEMHGEGTTLTCKNCGKTYEMDEYGRLYDQTGKFKHIPDWYNWQRECVVNQINDGNYFMDLEVSIGMMVDHKAIYMVGDGRLIHNNDGFTLTGCDGKLNYTQSPAACYGLYADYYWYEIGDVICIGNKDALYYCFPKGKSSVAKARIAAEELYKMNKNKRKAARE